MRVHRWQALGLGAAILLVLVLIVVLSAAPRTGVSASPTIALASGTRSASPVVTSPDPSSSTTSAPTASVPVPSASGAASWSRGMYLQLIDPQVGLVPSNTRLISVTRALQRSVVHNEMAWWPWSSGPWSPDGTAVVAADQSGQSFIIWPDSLTKLPPRSAFSAALPMWTWLDAGTVAAVAAAATSDELGLVRVDAHTGQILKRDAIIAWPYGSTVSPTGDWIAFSTAAPDGPNYEAITASTTQRVSSGPHTLSAGWLPDGRLVFVRQSGPNPTVEVRDPARPDATVLGRFDFPISPFQVLAQPSSAVVVVYDPRIDKNQLWTLRGTERRAVLLQYAFYGWLQLESISHDGRTASFSMPEMLGVGVRTGFIDLDTGAVIFICDGGCWGLVIN